MKKILLTLLAAVFVLVLSACGGETAPSSKPTEEALDGDPSQQQTQESGPVEETSEPEKGAYTVGDAVTLNDVVVTLVDVSESTGGSYMTPEEGKVFILCEFNIENNSGKDLAVSSIMSFEAYVDDYAASMSLSATLSSGKSQLDGSIADGKKMNGVIGYEADEGWETIEITFTPDVFFGEKATFVYAK